MVMTRRALLAALLVGAVVGIDALPALAKSGARAKRSAARAARMASSTAQKNRGFRNAGP